MSADGLGPNGSAEKTLGQIVTEVSEKASLLVREEIELAKTEVTSKISKLTKGAVVAGAAGVFLIFGITMLFHTLAWFLTDLFDWDPWTGFLAVTVFLFVLAGLAAFIAIRLFKKGVAAHSGPRDRGGQAHARAARVAERAARPGAAFAREGSGGDALMATGSRSPDVIRQSIEETRRELAFSVNDLRSKMTEITDWRAQLTRNRGTALVGAAVAGFVIGGGVAATFSLFSRRRR